MNVGDKVKVVYGYGGDFDGRTGTVTEVEGTMCHVSSRRGLKQHFTDEETGDFHLCFRKGWLEPIPTTPEVGTLAEIGAQVGDVVACYNASHDGTEFDVTVGFQNWGGYNRPWWRIISRASDAQSPIVLAMKQSFQRSGPVQLRKVIVPGVYGKVEIELDGLDDRPIVQMSDYMSRTDLIAARDVFNALIDAMEE